MYTLTLPQLRAFLPLFLAGLLSFAASAQQPVFEPVSPSTAFLPQRVYTNAIGQKHNQPAYFTHPDFGKLTFDAPFRKNVVEDISKRQPDSRYYIDLDEPTFFYIQQASKPINFYKDGYWRAIDATLHPQGDAFVSGAQPCPTELNVAGKFSAIQLGDEQLRFNNYRLKMVHTDGSVSLHTANWSNINVSNEGAYITDVFPGIDMQLVYREAGVESDFIIRENLHVDHLVFTDQLTYGATLNPFLYTDPVTGAALVIFDNVQTGEAEIKIDRARCHDASGNKHSWIAPYTLNGNLLSITCLSAQLNDPTMQYPITVDPLVTVIGPVASALNIMGSQLSPASCTNTLNVTFPGGTTPWDVSAYWNVNTDFCADDLLDYGVYIDCYRDEAEVWITNTCGGSSPVGAPVTIWTCAGCNSTGIWNPTMPFVSSGSQSLAQCYAPSCSDQAMSFTINSRRTYCTSNYGYDLCNYANAFCNTLLEWSVTVQGRNAETLGNTVTGNGFAVIPAASCAGTSLLDPTPLYGVPGYTYSWSTGASTPTINAANSSGVVTCTVTDACGTVRLATFTVTCPLAVELADFEATATDNTVFLSWETTSEKNNDYFSVERAGEDGVFATIGTVASLGDASSLQQYVFYDRKPLEGRNYYRLSVYDKDGSHAESDIRTVDFSTKGQTTVIPNPNDGTFELGYRFAVSGDYTLELLTSAGAVVYSSHHTIEAGYRKIPVHAQQLKAGVYQLKLTGGTSVVTEKIVIE